MSLRALPKIELHLHLDCSLSYQAVSKLAPSVTYEQYECDFVAPARCADLAEFLTRAPKGVALLQTRAALELVTADVFQQLAADGVIYAEFRFAPLLHTGEGLDPARVVEIVDDATERMIRETGIHARLILCTLRHFSESQSMETVQLVEAFRGTRVVAIDLAGDEAGFPIDAHIRAYEYALSRGLFRTAHAGEALGPNSVRETLRCLHPTRIGHGTRSVEDASLLDLLRAERIHLELCPSSNVQIIPEIADWRDHPIDRLYREGVPLNVNTDTRMLTRTTLTHEYRGLERTFGWGTEEFLTTNLMAIDAAFVDETVKQELRSAILAAYGSAPVSHSPRATSP